MEEWDDRSILKGIQLVHQSFFDHLVSINEHRPRVSPPQTEHWTILLRQLHSEHVLAQEPVFTLRFCVVVIFLMLFPDCLLSVKSPHLLNCSEVNSSEDVSHKRHSPGTRRKVARRPVSDYISYK